MPAETELLTRDAFRELTFARDGHTCVVPGCGQPAQDSHHIVERRLFEDGGYYLANGASVCGAHHLDCERTVISCDQLRLWCGIQTAVYPPGIDPPIDKWGNPLLDDGKRGIGPLFFDPSVQKILGDAGLLHDGTFVKRTKYPRTPHLPWSPGITRTHGEPDDDVLETVLFVPGQSVVITEKIDGENTTLMHGEGNIHARSLDGQSHPSRSYVKALHARIAWDIPLNMRIVGENVQAVHSLRYTDIPPFLVFAMLEATPQGWLSLSWREVIEWCALLDLAYVPLLYEGPWDEQFVRACFDWHPDDPPKSIYGPEREGYVVRPDGRFYERFMARNVAKYVRPQHVRTGANHWRHRMVEQNGLLAVMP